MAFDRSFPQSLASQAIANSEHFWPRLRFSPLRLKNAASFGSRDYDLRLPYAYSDPLPTSGGRTLQFAYGHKLSLTAALSLTPTPPAAPTVSARYRSTVNPMPPLAIPSRRCRVAALLPPFHADAILSATFLPPTEEEAAYITSPRHGNFHLSSATLCPPQAPMHGAPMHRLRSGCRPTTSLTPSYLRLRARAGRHIVLVQAHDKVPVTPCLRDTCRLL